MTKISKTRKASPSNSTAIQSLIHHNDFELPQCSEILDMATPPPCSTSHFALKSNAGYHSGKYRNYEQRNVQSCYTDRTMSISPLFIKEQFTLQLESVVYVSQFVSTSPIHPSFCSISILDLVSQNSPFQLTLQNKHNFDYKKENSAIA